ncbi:MAG: LysR family transcriptional regulator [Alphaproteobacteria bacterium]|nr:LysR family transcriptional regulator [Alphaproteobacteria bacterium]
MNPHHLQYADLRLLRVFMTVCRCGGLAAAQDELNISTSTISVHVSNLEKRLGMRLCHRGRGGFVLTEEGRTVLDASERLLSHVDDFAVQLLDIHGDKGGELTVGVIDNSLTNPGFSVDDVIRRYRAQYTGVTLSIHVQPPDQLANAIAEGELDVALGFFPRKVANLSYERLASTRMELYCGPGHPLFDADQNAITLEEVALHDHAQRGYVPVSGMPKPHQSFRYVARAFNIEGLAHLVLSGAYLAFLPVHYAENLLGTDSVRSILPNTLGYESRYDIAWRRSDISYPVLAGFIQTVRESVAKKGA